MHVDFESHILPWSRGIISDHGFHLPYHNVLACIIAVFIRNLQIMMGIENENKSKHSGSFWIVQDHTKFEH